MREILFRGKRSYNGEWVYGNLVVDTYGGSHIVPNEFFVEDGHHLRYEDDTDKPVFFNSETLGQFTGRYDKDGVRIFEGDIVRLSLPIAKDLVYTAIGKIVYDKSCAFSCEAPSKKVGTFSLVPDYKYEVIGNIYDNPELLEETK